MKSGLAAHFAEQAGACERAGSPLTAALLRGAADELQRVGAVRDLLQPLEGDPAASAPALRFAGALHRLVLERRAPALALHYPSVGGTAAPEDVWPVAREAVEEHAPELADSVRRPVQTNEVGRAAALFGALQHLVARTALPVRLLELAASGGLNLLVERFGYRVGGAVRGAATSPLVLSEPWQGDVLPPDVPVQVLDRAGCDPSPVDVRTTEGRLTLTSYVWADQVHRLERLRAAMRLAVQTPARVEPLPATALLARELAEPLTGVLTVVWHSVVWQYLPREERELAEQLLTDAGRRAGGAPLARVALEPARLGDPRSTFHLQVTSWPGGGTELLADASGHGPPVRWHALR